MSLRVCYNVYLPVRESPSHKSEMTSQLLFGERFGITEKAGNWLRIVTLFDSITGWIDGAHAISSEWDNKSKGIITAREINCIKPDKSVLRLAPGSEIHDLGFSTGTFTVLDEKWKILNMENEIDLLPDPTPLESAFQFINTPYLWGGRTPGGIDCSGLVQTAFKIHGIGLPRNSGDQVECGDTINFLEEALPGDLLFFSGESGSITHVGILAGKGKILHASGSVKTDPVDHQGIWNEPAGVYTHKLRIIKRIKI